VALERGDHAAAAREANTAIKAIMQISGTGSFPNTYWTIFLVAMSSLALSSNPTSEFEWLNAYRFQNHAIAAPARRKGDDLGMVAVLSFGRQKAARRAPVGS
jgi:hypothetical protein